RQHDRPLLPQDRRPYARPAETQFSTPERQQLLSNNKIRRAKLTPDKLQQLADLGLEWAAA
ncbi:hypothetical protein, partial [Streptomyces caelestis]|uniref:hypothetical protein n=1 Tax=Streptomyces caelestis TaxID=36816 RepID=UPI0036F93E53